MARPVAMRTIRFSAQSSPSAVPVGDEKFVKKVSQWTVKPTNTTGWAIFATEAVPAGKKIFTALPSGPLLEAPTMHTVQLAPKSHVVFSGGPQFTNHSCEPNSVMRFRGAGDEVEVDLVALRDISHDEMVTFDYNTTEWKPSDPFPCECGAKSCVGQFGGFSALSSDQQNQRLPLASPFILSQFQKMNDQASP